VSKFKRSKAFICDSRVLEEKPKLLVSGDAVEEGMLFAQLANAGAAKIRKQQPSDFIDLVLYLKPSGKLI
jgi:hypothetical protein